jgi:hypothetical protein
MVNWSALAQSLITVGSIAYVVGHLWEVFTATSHERCGHCGRKKLVDRRQFCMRCAP